MKKILFLSCIALAMACGGNNSSEPATQSEEQASAEDKTKNPDYQKGLELVAQNDCLTCHKVSETSTGPAYMDISTKYAGADEAQVKELALKIIHGGTGNWGSVPMLPHASLSEADAIAMTKYILLLSKP